MFTETAEEFILTSMTYNIHHIIIIKQSIDQLFFLQIHMKTMPTSMYRLLTGQENPVYI